MDPDALRAAMTKLRVAIAEYNWSIEEARKKRDKNIHEALNDGLNQKQIAEASGYTRETIRRILDPAAAEAVRKAAAERRRQKKAP